MKTCKTCGGVKPMDAFHNRAIAHDGKFSHCKACTLARNRLDYAANPEKAKARAVKWGLENPEKRKLSAAKSAKKYAEANRDKVNAWNRAWCSSNPDAVRVSSLRKKAYKRSVKTRWDEELDMFVDAEACALARLRASVVGGAWHIDHRVPLRGKTVSGLHNAYNLAVIPAKENMRKRHSYWENQPC